MSKPAQSRLESLYQKREKLTARIQAAEARVKTSERKKDTRRKILVGAYYLDCAKEKNTMEDIKKAMDKYLERESDRELFELPTKVGK